ncbi:transcriptional regulator [Bacillus cereus]|nr:transcriptional regulator [Bacillus cereus]
MDCFDAKTEIEAWNATIEVYGKGIRNIRINQSNRTRAEFLALD